MNGKNKVVLAIGAHPDDVEFGCGGTMAKLASEGAKLIFVVVTLGNRGSRSQKITAKKLIESRKQEQGEAAKILGAKEVLFLGHEDGGLTVDINLKGEFVRLIRKYKPDMIFTHDPNWIYQSRGAISSINHTDHRATGEAVLDAVYPLSRDLLSFPEQIAEGLEPHTVREVYLFNFSDPDFRVDVTRFINKKLESIFAHKSQMDDTKRVEKWVRERLGLIGKKSGVKYAEGFNRLVLR